MTRTANDAKRTDYVKLVDAETQTDVAVLTLVEWAEPNGANEPTLHLTDSTTEVWQIDADTRHQFCVATIPSDWTLTQMLEALEHPGCGADELEAVAMVVAVRRVRPRADTDKTDDSDKDDNEDDGIRCENFGVIRTQAGGPCSRTLPSKAQ